MIRQRSILLLFLGMMAGAGLVFSSFKLLREEYGKVGYYSDTLHGRKTASGEKYDKNLLTCAHKTLPFGTLVRITRLDNKLSLVARVNDRGPYRDGYIVEVSRRGAEELDLIKAGSAKVKLEVIEKPSEESAETVNLGAAAKSVRPNAADVRATGTEATRPAQYSTPASTKPTSATKSPATASGADATKLPAAKSPAAAGGNEVYQIDVQKPAKTGFGVQVSTLYNAPNVFPEVSKLQKYWPGKVMVSMQPMPEATENTVYKLILGPFTDRAMADKIRVEAAKKGYPKCFVVDLSKI